MKKTFKKISGHAIKEFVLYNIIFWLITLNSHIRNEFYNLLHNIVNNDVFVSTVVSLITGAISMHIGYKINKKND